MNKEHTTTEKTTTILTIDAYCIVYVMYYAD